MARKAVVAVELCSLGVLDTFQLQDGKFSLDFHSPFRGKLGWHLFTW